MSGTAYLTLENGMVFEGKYFGAQGEVTGEIVFTTGMTGYLETLTDPSYYGQIVVQTFPLIGNYGVIPDDFESSSVRAGAYIVKHPCQEPSNFRSEGSLDIFLSKKGVVGLCGIDTRMLVKIIREHGVMNGRITACKPSQVDIEAINSYHIESSVEAVSVREPALHVAENARYTVAMLDYGAKDNIRRELMSRGCDVWVLPWNSTARDIESIAPDGIMLSNGPGDPKDCKAAIDNLRDMLELRIPVFGICLGHQLLALAHGFKTHKLKYGHRGANQPVKNMDTGQVFITSQNHGYAVTSESIDKTIASEWYSNVNDGTCEGISYKNSPAFSVQFHPEACSGPQDTAFLFDRFIESIEVSKACQKTIV